MNVEEIIKQIKCNCDISDSRYWGYYSICGMLLRMRELYKQEKEIKPWQSIDRDDVSDWISSRETYWETLEGKNIKDIKIDGKEYNPFDVENINSVIKNTNLIYGGGYGLFRKPTFFLG